MKNIYTLIKKKKVLNIDFEKYMTETSMSEGVDKALENINPIIISLATKSLFYYTKDNNFERVFEESLKGINMYNNYIFNGLIGEKGLYDGLNEGIEHYKSSYTYENEMIKYFYPKYYKENITGLDDYSINQAIHLVTFELLMGNSFSKYSLDDDSIIFNEPSYDTINNVRTMVNFILANCDATNFSTNVSFNNNLYVNSVKIDAYSEKKLYIINVKAIDDIKFTCTYMIIVYLLLKKYNMLTSLKELIYLNPRTGKKISIAIDNLDPYIINRITDHYLK